MPSLLAYTKSSKADFAPKPADIIHCATDEHGGHYEGDIYIMANGTRMAPGYIPPKIKKWSDTPQ